MQRLDQVILNDSQYGTIPYNVIHVSNKLVKARSDRKGDLRSTYVYHLYTRVDARTSRGTRPDWVVLKEEQEGNPDLGFKEILKKRNNQLLILRGFKEPSSDAREDYLELV